MDEGKLAERVTVNRVSIGAGLRLAQGETDLREEDVMEQLLISFFDGPPFLSAGGWVAAIPMN